MVSLLEQSLRLAQPGTHARRYLEIVHWEAVRRRYRYGEEYPESWELLAIASEVARLVNERVDLCV